jgi:hypothetical protein
MLWARLTKQTTVIIVILDYRFPILIMLGWCVLLLTVSAFKGPSSIMRQAHAMRTRSLGLVPFLALLTMGSSLTCAERQTLVPAAKAKSSGDNEILMERLSTNSVTRQFQALVVATNLFNRVRWYGSTNVMEYDFIYCDFPERNEVMVFIKGRGLNAYPGNHASVRINTKTGFVRVKPGQ